MEKKPHGKHLNLLVMDHNQRMPLTDIMAMYSRDIWPENVICVKSVSWRLIQQKLGDISTVRKAFADYVDSLCGTPYPMDYDIWLRRLRRNIHEEDHGKEIDATG
ncbi:hypothetical protein PIB30_080270 [Stylosanthes scabra]|uniref:Uncharacterized protein n=1 Tax=Stylosanthes scabra TaxID=79078 RepID=A0ABU6STC6_9FABA|nr:hypothetical protein [Stylosanthes scabra]